MLNEQMRMHKTLCLKLSIIGLFLINCTDQQSSENALNEFLTHQTKESYLAIPLCNAGEKVVPLLTEKVKDKNLKRRRYAIGFLGVTESKLPVSVLEKIVKDETDNEFYRGDSLQSLYLLDESLGKTLANNYQNMADYLGETAREIMQVKNHSIYKKERRELICNPND